MDLNLISGYSFVICNLILCSFIPLFLPLFVTVLLRCNWHTKSCTYLKCTTWCFNISIHLLSHQHSQNSEHFYHPQKLPCSLIYFFLLSSLTWSFSQASTYLLSAPLSYFPFSIILHKKNNTICTHFRGGSGFFYLAQWFYFLIFIRKFSMFIYLFLNIYLFIYLAVLGLSCRMRDLCCGVQDL